MFPNRVVGRCIPRSRLAHLSKHRWQVAVAVEYLPTLPLLHYAPIRQAQQKFSGYAAPPQAEYDGGSGARFDSELDAVAAGQAALEFTGLSRFTVEQFETANDVLNYFRYRPDNTAGQVALCFDLLERVVIEAPRTGNDKYMKKIESGRFYVPILNQWKNISKEHPETVASPKAVTQRLYNMSETCPTFKLTTIAVSIILEALVLRSSVAEAPVLAAKLVDFLQTEAKKDPSLQPDVYIYSILIHAWAESGLSDAGEQIEKTLKTMLRQQISPSPVTYNIMLKYWSSIGDVRKCNSMLRRMKLHGVSQTGSCWKHMIEGFLTSGHLVEAEKLLRKQIREVAVSGEEVDQLIPAINFFSRAHKLEMRLDSFKKQSSANAVERVASLCDGYDDAFSDDFRDKTYLGFMDVLALGGRSTRVESLLRRLQQPTEAAYGVLIKAYSISRQADQAVKTAQELMNDHRVPLTSTRAFNGVLRAFANPEQSNGFDKAYEFTRLMENNCRCQKYGITPDSFTYMALLQCLRETSPSEHAGAKAQEILHEMRIRKVSAGAHEMTMAIKVCMRNRDYGRADEIMKEMESSSTPPTRLTYHAIMHHWAMLGSKAAAERTERILLHMKHLSKATPSLSPSSASYNVATRAWVQSKSPDASQRIWDLYEDANKAGCAMDVAQFSTIISFYCTTNDPIDVQRADELVLIMEKAEDSETYPSTHHYKLVTSAWFKQDNVQCAINLALRRVRDYSKAPNSKGQSTANYIHQVVETAIQKGGTLKATVLVAKIQELYDSNLLDFQPKLETLMLLHDSLEGSSDSIKKEHLARLAHQIFTYPRGGKVARQQPGRMAA